MIWRRSKRRERIMPPVPESLEQWARELLGRCTLPVAKALMVTKVYLVEPGAICFVAKKLIGSPKPYTALLANGTNGAYIKSIKDGWTLPPDPEPVAVPAVEEEGECEGS